jgi:hypothetical protein
MSVARTILRWVIQPICTLIIGRACLEVAHGLGWYPERQLASLILGTPSVVDNDLFLWGLAAIIGAVLWGTADYFLYRRTAEPKAGHTHRVAVPLNQLS